MLLYKYYGDGEWVFNNLKKSHLYYNDFKNVNDPYECVINFKLSTEWLESIEHDINNGLLDEGYFEIKEKSQIDEIKKIFKKDSYELSDTISLFLRSVFLDMFGVSCFSTKNDSILMWGHYSNGFKGICVEYEIPDSLSGRLVEVKYDDIPFTVNSDLPSIFEGKFTITEAKDIFSIKHSDWSYEKEWRVVGGKNSIEKLPESSIKSIFFGVKSTKEYREKVISSLNHTHEINYFNMKQTFNSFKVEFEKVDEIDAYNTFSEIDMDALYDKLLCSDN